MIQSIKPIANPTSTKVKDLYILTIRKSQENSPSFTIINLISRIILEINRIIRIITKNKAP